jgi:hypothetical protein
MRSREVNIHLNCQNDFLIKIIIVRRENIGDDTNEFSNLKIYERVDFIPVHVLILCKWTDLNYIFLPHYINVRRVVYM